MVRKRRDEASGASASVWSSICLRSCLCIFILLGYLEVYISLVVKLKFSTLAHIMMMFLWGKMVLVMVLDMGSKKSCLFQ
jgi:hypothetical protein